MREIDYTSARDAHLRIDELDEDFKKMSKCMERIAEFQEKTAKSSNAIKWLAIGGLGFYVLENIGLVEFLKSVT